jgi:hypothetical protein
MKNNYSGMPVLPYHISCFPQFYVLLVCVPDFRPSRWSLQKHKIGFCSVSILTLVHVTVSLGHDQGEHMNCKKGSN